MENKIKNILSEYDEQIKRYEDQLSELEWKVHFCSQHKFNEEIRILNLKREALELPIHRWRKMYNELNSLISKPE